jgi:hypothetical protein
MLLLYNLYILPLPTVLVIILCNLYHYGYRYHPLCNLNFSASALITSNEYISFFNTGAWKSRLDGAPNQSRRGHNRIMKRGIHQLGGVVS